ncbi:MAG: purine-binding chemotaxis protein CheW [Spirochaetaceae bacterium]|nr:purine-binding chemotaxis protein CheW [Myxococcales bacterium]MCB9723429.1 purine-binding chemotaxis protein CheW [Spirochaetaceae bacterium]
MNEAPNGSIETVQVREGTNQYLTFLLDGEEYGVDILRVQEIRGWEGATQVPNTPPYVRGVINLRGTIVPIIDLRQRFGLEVVEYGPSTVVVVLRTENGDDEKVMGIVVDAVSEVYNFAADEVKPPPNIGDQMDMRYARGLAQAGDGLVIVLEIDQILSGLGGSVFESANN